MKEWIDLEDELPESGVQVEVKDKDGVIHQVFRGGPVVCSNCWYSPIGGQLLISPTHWREINEEQKIDTSKKIDIYEILRKGLI